MLRIVNSTSVSQENVVSRTDSGALSDHNQLIQSYLQSHRVRNHAPATIKKEGSFLENWFADMGQGDRPLWTWDAMNYTEGRMRIKEYGQILVENDFAPKTIRNYLSILDRYFSFVLEFPFVKVGNQVRRIDEYYGTTLAQPVSEYDRPIHSYDGEQKGIPLDPGKLFDFYSFLRRNYLRGSSYPAIGARNYAMVVCAGETGLRIDEILHLEMTDLFFESRKIQTRHAKSSRGSGKKARITLFPPLARDSIRYYLKNHRSALCIKGSTELLFPSKSGKQLPYSSAQNALTEMIGLARLKQFPVHSHLTWHWFRRLFATRFIEEFPGKLSVLLELLGHSNMNTVHKYIRHSGAWMDRQIQSVLEGENRNVD
jgi:site-specific recombinase XerD